MLTDLQVSRIFHLYCGCSVVSYTNGNPFILELQGVRQGEVYIYNHWRYIRDYKLALKKLEDITDEDAIELVFLEKHNRVSEKEILKIEKGRDDIIISYRWKPENPQLANEDGFCYSASGVHFFGSLSVFQTYYLSYKRATPFLYS